MKKLLYIAIFISVLFTAKADYWKKIENIPQSYKNNYWLDIFFLPSNTNYGWVCGFNGRTMRTTDGGNSWSGSTVSNNGNLESIHFPTQNIGYTSGNAGVFKSTNGGLSWFDITPNLADGIWGLYFIDADYGVAIGGGCVTNRQQFFHTTNGGSSWTLSQYFEPNSGLTDAIIYERDGLGFAVSSGLLWITNDGGRTWAIHKQTGTKLWQEEITRIGNSFLLPYAGTTCGGGGVNGGMRFSTNGGNSWNDYNTGVVMFGTFLLSTTSGWACGDNEGVYFTSDAGMTWEKRNCGLDPNANLDDIWFNSSVDGWVVGDGIYKLSNSDSEISRDLIIFEQVCLNEERGDTLTLYNRSNDMTNVKLSLSGDVSDFTVLSNPNFSMVECDDLILTILFKPKSKGLKVAQLTIVFDQGGPNEKSYQVRLEGNSIETDAYPNADLFERNSVRVGESVQIPILWSTSNEKENINKVQKDPPINQIYFDHMTPVSIFKTGVILYFVAQPTDTGWFETEFTFTLGPCTRDTTVKVRVYGISPIISSEEIVEFPLYCEDDTTQLVEIVNTGNDDLIISSFNLIDGDGEFSFLKWSNNLKLPITIPIGESIFAEIKYTMRLNGDKSASFIIENNDSTKANGIKNPWTIQLIGDPSKSEVITEYQVLDFGDVCVGQNTQREFSIYNFGNISTEVDINNIDLPFKIIEPLENFIIRSNDSIPIKISFTPSKMGEFRDTLKLYDITCDDSMFVVIHGWGISNELSILPNRIVDYIKLNEYYEYEIMVYNTGNREAEIYNIFTGGSTGGIEGEVVEPTQNTIIPPGDSLLVKVRYIAKMRLTLHSFICVYTINSCQTEACIPFTLTASNRSISADNSIDFGLMKCESVAINEIINIKNETAIQDTISNIYLKNNNSFRLINLPQFDYLIEGNEVLPVTIEFDPNNVEGIYTDTLIVVSKNPGGQTIEIPINAEYKKANTFLISPETQDIVLNNNYFKDLGIFETCDSEIVLTFEFENTGLLNDTIEISSKSSNAYLLAEQDIYVNSGEKTTINVLFDPSELNPDINSSEIIISSKICNHVIKINLEAERIDPMLEISPKTIEFGEHWFDESAFQTVTIKNKFPISRTIVNLRTENNFKVFEHDLDIPTTLNPNEEITFNIAFKAIEEGNFSDKLIIEEQSSCMSEQEISFSGYVPEEIYNIDITLDDHVVFVGDTVVMHMELRNPIPKFKTDKFTFQLDFDKRLLYPNKLWIKDGIYFKNNPFTYIFGEMIFDVENEMAMNLMKEEGIIAKIEFLTLASIPDYTDVLLQDIDTYTDKDFNYSKKDGSVQITGYCESEVLFKISLYPTFESRVNETANYGNILINYNSSSEQDASLILSDVLGNQIHEQDFKMLSGEHEISLSVENTPSGIYFVKIISKFGIERFGKVIILK